MLAATPDAWLAWQNLSLVLAASERWDEAVAAARETVRHDPANNGPRALLELLLSLRERVAATPPDSAARDVAAVSSLLDLHLSVAARRRLAVAVAARGPSAEFDRLRAQIDAAERPSVQ